jgi:formylglycine-generating enzyme required for sulfatase activity
MPTRKVTITKPFYMGVHEVTQAQYTKVMGTNPAEFKGDDFPVDNVSWNDTQAFCKKLSEMDPKGSYRLPTEAEWEYACRAGTKTLYFYGDKVTDGYAWTRKNSRDKGPNPVGKLKPNAWGLYDMAGNVWEWCQDYHAPSYTGAKSVDPTGPVEGDDRVIRGGSWHFYSRSSRSANRHNREPGRGEGDTGFRVVFVPVK